MSVMTMDCRVFAVIIAYRAEPGQVLDNLRQLQGSLAGLVLVDNSPARDPQRWEPLRPLSPVFRVRLNGVNAGVAAGFNQGMDLAWQAAADFVLLLDDDSRPADGMVAALLRAWQGSTPDVIAAVGPDAVIDHAGQRPAYVRLARWWFRRCRCSAANLPLRTDLLMSSGSLIHRDAAHRIGPFRAQLFIDYVDTEWCMRGRRQGYHCLVACDARMQHRFGDRTVQVPGLGRPIVIRAPQRSYYIYRNALFMFRQPCCPPGWKGYEALRLLCLAGVQLLFAPQRRERLQQMLLGLMHGLRGREGPAPIAGRTP